MSVDYYASTNLLPIKDISLNRVVSNSNYNNNNSMMMSKARKNSNLSISSKTGAHSESMFIKQNVTVVPSTMLSSV